MTTRDALPYEEIHHPSYNLVAAGTADVRIVPSERDPAEIIVAGPCVRCGHGTSFQQSIDTYRDLNWAPLRDKVFNRAMREAAAGVTERAVTVYCRCGGHHPDTPFGKLGCGAYWKLNVKWRSDG